MKASLTVAENARFWARYLGTDSDGVESALASFGLAALRDIPAGYLSAGQRRRLSLARLADNPTVPTPIGIFRDVQRPVYGRGGSVRATPATEVELADLLLGADSWTVG